MSDRLAKILYADPSTHEALRKLATKSSRTMKAELQHLVEAGQERSTSFSQIKARFDQIEARIAMLERAAGIVRTIVLIPWALLLIGAL